MGKLELHLSATIPQLKWMDIEKAKAKGVNINDIYNTINATFESLCKMIFFYMEELIKLICKLLDTYRKMLKICIYFCKI